MMDSLLQKEGVDLKITTYKVPPPPKYFVSTPKSLPVLPLLFTCPSSRASSRAHHPSRAPPPDVRSRAPPHHVPSRALRRSRQRPRTQAWYLPIPLLRPISLLPSYAYLPTPSYALPHYSPPTPYLPTPPSSPDFVYLPASIFLY
eukprot:3940661-Rhodomonas_salina.1